MIRNEKSQWADKLIKGQTFDLWAELKGYVIDHGVECERIIRILKDKIRWIRVCKMNDKSVDAANRCGWKIRAMEKKKIRIITITIAKTIHSCEAGDHWKRRMHTNASRLATKITEIIMRNRQTRPSSTRDTVQALVHPDLQYHIYCLASQ